MNTPITQRFHHKCSSGMNTVVTRDIVQAKTAQHMQTQKILVRKTLKLVLVLLYPTNSQDKLIVPKHVLHEAEHVAYRHVCLSVLFQISVHYMCSGESRTQQKFRIKTNDIMRNA